MAACTVRATSWFFLLGVTTLPGAADRNPHTLLRRGNSVGGTTLLRVTLRGAAFAPWGVIPGTAPSNLAHNNAHQHNALRAADIARSSSRSSA